LSPRPFRESQMLWLTAKCQWRSSSPDCTDSCSLDLKNADGVLCKPAGLRGWANGREAVGNPSRNFWETDRIHN
jgi:hypothetical protein